MKLPRGATGFRHVDEAPLPETDFAKFKRSCYEVTRLLAGQVRLIEKHPDVTANYYRAELDTPYGAVSVLLNAIHPILSFAKPVKEGECEFEFVDVPLLSQAFESVCDYTIMQAVELNARADAETYELLGRVELEQIKYWKPKSVGAILFNFWD